MGDIYLDHNATTPLLKEASDRMAQFNDSEYGNPSSIHSSGRRAKKHLEAAREQLAKVLNCRSEEILFTSGGTESNNLAISGTAARFRDTGVHIITSPVEHKSVLEVCKHLERNGVALTILPTDPLGRIRIDALKSALRPDTRLVSIMLANNEVGTVQDIASIGAITRAHGCILHSDMVQGLGKMKIDLTELPVDLVTVSAHKIGGPKGVGALILRNGTTLQPMLYGGSQNGGIRPGTENLAGIVGFGVAAEVRSGSMASSINRMETLRRDFIRKTSEKLDFAQFNGDQVKRLPNTISVSLPGCDLDTVLMSMDAAGVAVSVGSACTAGVGGPSHVLEAMGLPKSMLDCTLRVSIGVSTTPDDIERAVNVLVESAHASR